MPQASRGVYSISIRTGRSGKPFSAYYNEGGKSHSLGQFSSAAEAALAYARHLGRASSSALSTSLNTTSMTRATSSSTGHRSEMLIVESAARMPTPKPPPAPVLVDEHGEWYQVEALLASRRTAAGTREFLVRWQGYSAEDDSWEPESGILPEVIREFDKVRRWVTGSPPPSQRRPAKRPASLAGCSTDAMRPGALPAGAWRPRANDTVHEQRIGPDHQVLIPAMIPPSESAPCSRPEGTLISHSSSEHDACNIARTLTAAAFGPSEAFCFIMPCDVGLGLYARVPLQAGQFISE